MIDLGVSKIALIGAVALIVIGPEKLPRLARTIGALIGKAQRYVADVKNEVNRAVEMEELKKAQASLNQAAQTLNSVGNEIHGAVSDAIPSADQLQAFEGASGTAEETGDAWAADGAGYEASYEHPKKNWRLRQGAIPRWYRQRQVVRTHVLSASARMVRHQVR